MSSLISANSCIFRLASSKVVSNSHTSVHSSCLCTFKAFIYIYAAHSKHFFLYAFFINVRFDGVFVFVWCVCVCVWCVCVCVCVCVCMCVRERGSEGRNLSLLAVYLYTHIHNYLHTYILQRGREGERIEGAK